MTDNITKLNVRFKQPPKDDEPMLKVVTTWQDQKCDHRYIPGSLRSVQYLIREGETEIECGHCHTKLDPMFVIKRLAHEETSWLQTRQNYMEEIKRLEERKKTKCLHCGKMTNISRR